MKPPARDDDGSYRFRRARWRSILDLAICLVGGLIFGGVALAALIGDFGGSMGAGRFVFGAVFGFFGLLWFAGALNALTRMRNPLLFEVGPSGIWTPETGHIDWYDVAEFRRETWQRPAGRIGGRQLYKPAYRLGIVLQPNAYIHPTRAPGLAWRMAGAYYGAIRRMPFGPNLGFQDLARYGVRMEDLGMTLDEVVPLVAEFHPVVQPPQPSVA